ncbi:MAG TPA: hypothetical protein VL463_30005 [Kofleriaceae bacterium]|nr:hypothetical protein [Kofleriaceae bacterium]
MTCPCDERSWPPTLSIPAGLDDLPRQLVTFADLRAEMLARASMQPALGAWRGRSRDDYGVMLLELWAYVGELLSIYDKAIADESYVRTAKLRPSLRRLVASLGYQPKPAVAATAELALLADGTKPLVLPVGTAFRSGSFGTEKPQVFELTAAATIHPALDRWPMATPPATTLAGSVTQLLIDPATNKLAIGDVVLVELTAAAADAYVRKVTAIDRIVDDAGRRVAKVTLDRAVNAGAGVPVSGIAIKRATRKAALKSPSAVGNDFASFFWFFAYVFVLDGVYRDLHTGERFLVENAGEQRWMTVSGRGEQDYTLVEESSTDAQSITIKDANGNKTGQVDVPSQYIPPVMAPFTVISSNDYLDDAARKASPSSTTWSTITDPTVFTIHFGLIEAGRVLGPALPTLAATDPLRAIGTRAPLDSAAVTGRIILRDVENDAIAISASIDLSTGIVTASGGTTWSPSLATPVTGFGNVVTAVRGESAGPEILGDGDASRTHQTFMLAKKPLTYVAAAATDSGVASTLSVWVDGLLWTEVPTLFGQSGTAQVYTIRQDDTGASSVIFGDGVAGARLPTGVGNVVARYRFGAGAAAPPAGSISQIVKPVSGLKSVVGPLAALGGADAEPASSLATLAPRSALLLGAAISIDDMEVAALGVAGVTTARADWAWDGVYQRPVVKVWVIGGDGVAQSFLDTITARLRALSEPNTPIRVAYATEVAATLAIDLELDPRRVPSDVLATVTAALTDATTGWLQPAQLGIDRPLFRSALIERLLDLTGVTGVRGLTWNGDPLVGYGVAPGNGAYFDLVPSLTVTGS